MPALAMTCGTLVMVAALAVAVAAAVSAVTCARTLASKAEVTTSAVVGRACAMMLASFFLTLETAMEWIAADELVEVTPHRVRVRKAVLSAEQRKKVERQRV